MHAAVAAQHSAVADDALTPWERRRLLRGGAAREGERGGAAGGGLGEVALREEELAATTNFVLAQFVIRECKPSEFFFVMERTPAKRVASHTSPCLWSNSDMKCV